MAAAVSEPPDAMTTSEEGYLAKEIDMLSGDLMEDLREYFDEINITGRFATMRKLDQVVDPQDVLEESLKLTRVVDADGNVIVTDLEVDECDVLQSESYDDRDPDEHEYEGWTGNAGATSTHWYRDSVLLLVPNEHIASVFVGQDRDYGYGTSGDTKVLAILRNLVKRARCRPGPQGESLRKGLMHMGYTISNNRIKTTHSGTRSHKYTDATVSEAITVCVEFGLTDVVRGLSSAFKDSLSEGALQSLSNLKHTTDVNVPEERLGHRCFGRDVLESGLTYARRRRCDSQNSNFGHQRVSLERSVCTVGPYMLFAAIDNNASESYPTSKAKCKARTQTSFMMAFLSKMFESSGSLTENVLSISKPLIRIVITNFSLRKSQPPQPRPTYTYETYGASSVKQAPRKPALDGRILANVLGHMRNLQLHEHGQLLVASIISETSSMDPQDYKHTMLPCLKSIIVRLLEGKDETDMYKELFQTCLSRYINRFVGQEPVQINWSRNPVRCNCRDCMDLNAFLRSPVDRVKRLRVSKQRRHHLHTQLDTYTDCTHITERGYKETLVVTKQGKSFEENLKTWTDKAKSALATLRSLEDQESTSDSPSQLRKLLGDKYAEIMTLRRVGIMTATQQEPTQTVVASSSASNAATAGTSTTTATQPGIPQIAGRKRKAVVIDLTYD
ncbi:unnamed protein product, partial [Aureobasidium vineae]